MAGPHDHPKRLCGATTRNGGKCQRWAVPGRTRCKLHGGLSTGPNRRFWETDEQRAERIAAAVANMVAGRRLWLASLKKRGEKAPCGRKSKGAARQLSEKERLNLRAGKADKKRIEAPYRRFLKEREAEERRREAVNLARQEQQRIAEENALRANPNVYLPGETLAERAARVARIAERLRRVGAKAFRNKVESKVLAGTLRSHHSET